MPNKSEEFYTIDGKQYPRVTNIIRSAGFKDGLDYINQDVLQRAQDFGSAVHLACHLWDTNVKMKPLDIPLQACLNQWIYYQKKHRRELGSFVGSEIRVKSDLWGYAGTLDKAYTKAIVDVKTGAEDDTVGIQISAYEIAYRETMGIKKSKKLKRIVVYLSETKATPVVLDNPNDWLDFCACFRIFNRKNRRR